MTLQHVRARILAGLKRVLVFLNVLGRASRMIIPVILSGGTGARLWPLSRAMYPKQFIRFFDGQSSLLGATLRRLGHSVDFAAPIVVCNSDHRFLVREELTRGGVEAQAILLEPVARNTAAAVAAAALVAARQDSDALVAILPTDHLIRDTTAFCNALVRASNVAKCGKIVLFGSPPSAPHTGYGYIRCGKALEDGGYAIEAFYEKPEPVTAACFAADPAFLWNSGIIVAKARTLIDETEHLAPAVLNAARAAVAGAADDLGFLRLDPTAFANSPTVSIDTSILEKTKTAVVLPIGFAWGDVSSWSTLWESSPHDAAGNAVEGDAVLIDTCDSLIHSDRSLVATIGVDDLIIVDTPDALLVADKARAQDVSGLVARLKHLNRKEHAQHLRNYRPWGYFETLSLGPRFQVKLLHVNPGGLLSMQMHHHRSEHWVVVSGTAKVTIGDCTKLVQENESVYVTATQWHRLENPGKVDLELIEVQLGSYLGEDDIVRSDDIYHRAADETR
jgi:mannose-1-phosphate guanylyltransferase/mannose-6-phosphate isomerase